MTRVLARASAIVVVVGSLMGVVGKVSAADQQALNCIACLADGDYICKDPCVRFCC